MLGCGPEEGGLVVLCAVLCCDPLTAVRRARELGIYTMVSKGPQCVRGNLGSLCGVCPVVEHADEKLARLAPSVLPSGPLRSLHLSGASCTSE